MVVSVVVVAVDGTVAVPADAVVDVWGTVTVAVVGLPVEVN